MKISIIIATYNAGKTLRNCLESIIPQLGNDIELIIIDGASKDDTVKILKEYASHLAYSISEPDKGIYDAWNKGISKACGEWIMFLGADDQLVSDALQSYTELINSIIDIEQIEFISSRVQMIDISGKPIGIKGWQFEWPLFLKEMTVAHPGALHSKKMFQKYGLYDVSYKIVGDYEFLLRAGASLKAIYLDKISVIMSEGGVSDSTNSIREHYRAAITTGNYPKWKGIINCIIVYLKFRIKQLARKFGFNIHLRKP